MMEPMPQSKILTVYRIILPFIQETFRILLVGYIILLVIDQLIPGFASFQIHLNALLWAVIITGLITVLVRQDPISEARPAARPGLGARAALVLVSLIGAYVVFSKLGELGDWRFVMALLSAGFIYLLGSQLLFDDQSQQ
jgi:hypothetical protein